MLTSAESYVQWFIQKPTFYSQSYVTLSEQTNAVPHLLLQSTKVFLFPISQKQNLTTDNI